MIIFGRLTFVQESHVYVDLGAWWFVFFSFVIVVDKKMKTHFFSFQNTSSCVFAICGQYIQEIEEAAEELCPTHEQCSIDDDEDCEGF